MEDNERNLVLGQSSSSEDQFRSNRRRPCSRVLLLVIGGICVLIGVVLLSLTSDEPNNVQVAIGPKTTAFFSVSGFYFARATLTPTGTNFADRTRLYSCKNRPPLNVQTFIDEQLTGFDELYPQTWRARYLFLNAQSSLNVSFCAPRGVRSLVYATSANLVLPLSNYASYLTQNITIRATNCTGSTPENGYVLIRAEKDGPYQFVFENDYDGTDFDVKCVYNITIRGSTWQYRVDDCLHSCVPNQKGSFDADCSLSIPFTSRAGVVVTVGGIPGWDPTHRIDGLALSYEKTNRLRAVGGSLFAMGGAILIVVGIFYYRRNFRTRLI